MPIAGISVTQKHNKDPIPQIAALESSDAISKTQYDNNAAKAKLTNDRNTFIFILNLLVKEVELSQQS